MKVCPKGHLNDDVATQCEICDAPFPPAVASLASTPVSLAATPVDVRPAGISHAAELERVKVELADALSQMLELQRLLAAADTAPRQFATTTVPENAAVSAKPSAANATRGALGLTAIVGLVQNWPKVATGAASIIATLGTVFTAFHFGVGGLGAAPDRQPTAEPTANVATPATNGAADPHVSQIDDLKTQVAVAVKAREESEARASGFENQLAGVKKEVTTASAARDGFKEQVLGLQNQLAGSVKELATVTAARDQAVGRANASAQPRPQPRVESPRMGTFDFRIPDKKTDEEFVIRKSDVDPRSPWPTGDCTVLPLIPLDDKDRPFPVAANCTAERILIKKPRGLNKDRVVKLIWQLK